MTTPPKKPLRISMKSVLSHNEEGVAHYEPQMLTLFKGKETSVKVARSVRMQEGKLFVTTSFTGSPKRDEKVVLQVCDSTDNHLDALQHNWREIREELLETAEQAKQYAAIKNRGKADPRVTELLIECVALDYGMMYPRFANIDALREGVEDSSKFPLGSFSWRMDLFRTSVTEGRAEEPALKHVRFDDIERIILKLENKRHDITTAITNTSMAGNDGDDEHGGGLAVQTMPAETSRSEPFKAFHHAVENAVRVSNEAWFEAATHLSKGQPVDNRHMELLATIIKEHIQDAKRAYQQFDNEIKDSHLAYELRGLHSLVYGETAQDRGLFPLLDKLAVTLGDESLLRSAIEKGLRKHRSK